MSYDTQGRGQLEFPAGFDVAAVAATILTARPTASAVAFAAQFDALPDLQSLLERLIGFDYCEVTHTEQGDSVYVDFRGRLDDFDISTAALAAAGGPARSTAQVTPESVGCSCSRTVSAET